MKKTDPNPIETEVFDVIIVGAGISGVAAAYHMQKDRPNRKIAVLEGRASMGGTWDLFQYPGIRSDSDMQTLGFSFNPWRNPKAIADGPSILQYVKDTATEFNLNRFIRYNHMVNDASWSDEDGFWTVQIAPHESVAESTIRTKFLFMCSGYYDYKAGYSPTFPNSEAFKGIIMHPQKWDTELDYTDKKIVVIGSGATAVTLVPELAKKAAKVTMLQRSPTYMVNLPSKDAISNGLRKILPEKWAYSITRWKNILIGLSFYNAARTWPRLVKKVILKGVKQQLSEDAQLKHFTPNYNPWDQRVCVVPDADLFKAIRKQKAEVVTDQIERFTEKGILLRSGSELEADIIVTATGLVLKLLGGMTVSLNGKAVVSSERHVYRGVMLSDQPNFAIAIGYTNASWTLKCELSCKFVARILDHMEKNGLKTCTPRFDHSTFTDERLLDFEAGYVKRADDMLPKQGSSAPWKVHQNYLKDTLSLKFGTVTDRFLEYR